MKKCKNQQCLAELNENMPDLCSLHDLSPLYMSTPDNKREECSCEPNDNVNFPCSCKCHKRERSQCCGAVNGKYHPQAGNYFKEGNGKCVQCGKPFEPKEERDHFHSGSSEHCISCNLKDSFLEKTLAEFDARADQYIFDAINLRKTEDEPELLQKHRDFLCSALNAQREEIREKALVLKRYYNTKELRDPKLSLNDVLALLFPNNKENE